MKILKLCILINIYILSSSHLLIRKGLDLCCNILISEESFAKPWHLPQPTSDLSLARWPRAFLADDARLPSLPTTALPGYSRSASDWSASPVVLSSHWSLTPHLLLPTHRNTKVEIYFKLSSKGQAECNVHMCKVTFKISAQNMISILMFQCKQVCKSKESKNKFKSSG